METEVLIEKISLIEEQITMNIDLLEIAKDYCEYNFDKAREIAALSTIINIILAEQHNLARSFDGIC